MSAFLNWSRMENHKNKVAAMGLIEGENRLILHDADDREAREVSQAHGWRCMQDSAICRSNGTTMVCSASSPLTCLELAWRISCISWNLE